MSRREQPYLPLYVMDFLTDEKLVECSAESTGVYIRLMCLMHKSEQYGAILLKQKDKQTGKQIYDFACKLMRQMPYDIETIERSLTELLNEGVLSMDGDVWCVTANSAIQGLLREKEADKGEGRKTARGLLLLVLLRILLKQKPKQTLKMKLKLKMNMKLKIKVKMKITEIFRKRQIPHCPRARK